MRSKLTVGGLFLFAILPIVALADNQDSNIYKQCQDACAGDGLNCVNKCLASNREVAQPGNNGSVAVGNGQNLGDGELANSPAADNLRNRVEEQPGGEIEAREGRFRRR